MGRCCKNSGGSGGGGGDCCKKQKPQLPIMRPFKKIIRETPNVMTFVFDYSVGARPGQFINLWIPRVDEKPFSVAFDDGKELWVTFFAVGPFTKLLQTYKEGDLVGIRGPYGSSYDFREGEHLALVAGGYGAAPMYFVATEALKKGCKIEFIVGARGSEHLLFLKHVEELKKVGAINLHIATDDGSKGFKGYNVSLLRKIISEGIRPEKIFGCGPEMMLKSLSNYCAEEKIPAQFSLERYMKCGFGVCGHCAMDPLGLLTCKDGPVFNNEICRQLTEFGEYERDKNGKKVFFEEH